MKVTTIRAWRSQGVYTLQVDFGEIGRHHAIRLYPDEDHIDFANMLHALAEGIRHDPHLNSNASAQLPKVS